MHYASDPAYVAGIDIGGTNTRCAIASIHEPTRLLAHWTDRTQTPEDLPRFLDFIARGLHSCLSDAKLPLDALVALGCASPGIINNEGLVYTASNLGWNNVPLATLLEERTGLASVVENDVRAAALAEQRHGAGKGRSSLVYFTISTGVSAGIILDGKPVRGHRHAAGEVARFLPDPSHVGKDWEPNGCLELNAGGVGLARSWAALTGDTNSTASAADVFAFARAGNPDAKALVDRAATYLAQAAVAISALLDPEILVLGGSIAQHEAPIAARIREVLAETLLFPPEVTLAALGGDAPLMGALLMAAEHAAISNAKVSL